MAGPDAAIAIAYIPNTTIIFRIVPPSFFVWKSHSNMQKSPMHILFPRTSNQDFSRVLSPTHSNDHSKRNHPALSPGTMKSRPAATDGKEALTEKREFSGYREKPDGWLRFAFTPSPSYLKEA
jgi:hypothetical protein